MLYKFQVQPNLHLFAITAETQKKMPTHQATVAPSYIHICVYILSRKNFTVNSIIKHRPKVLITFSIHFLVIKSAEKLHFHQT